MKPSNRIPLVVATVVVLAVVAGTFVLRGRDKATLDDANVAAQDAPADAAIAPPPAPPVSPGDAGRGQSAEDLRGDHVARRAQMRRDHEARISELREQSAQRYASEQVDPAWAPQKESELKDVANQPGFEVAGAQPRSLSIDCRSSMCRINGEFESNGKAEDWILVYMSSVGSSMPNSVVSRKRNPDGSMGVEIYGRAR
ncbi:MULTISPECIES: hypothetical protein [unclassified Luteimonas]